MKFLVPFLLIGLVWGDFNPSPKEFSPVKIISKDGDVTTVESSGTAPVTEGNYADAYQLAYYKAGNNALLGASKVDLEAFSHVNNDNFMSLMKEIQKGEIVDRDVKDISWDRLGNSVSVVVNFKIRSTTTSDPNRLQVLCFDLTKDTPPKTKAGTFYVGEGKTKSLLLLDQKITDMLLKRIEAINPADFWSIKSVTMADKVERRNLEIIFDYDDTGREYRKSLFQMIEKIYYYRMPKEYYIVNKKKTSFQIDAQEWTILYIDRMNVTTQFSRCDTHKYSLLNFATPSEFNKTRPEIMILPNDLTNHPIAFNNVVYLNLQILDANGKELGVINRQITRNYINEYDPNLPFYKKKYKKWTLESGTREYDEDGYYIKVTGKTEKEYTRLISLEDIQPSNRQSIHVIHAGFDNKELPRNYYIEEKLAKLKDRWNGKNVE